MNAVEPDQQQDIRRRLIGKYYPIPIITVFNIIVCLFLFRMPFAITDDFIMLYYSERFNFINGFFTRTDCWPWSYRPVASSFYAIEYALFGNTDTGYFATNLLLLIILACLIYYLIYKVTSDRLIALLGALLFSSQRFVLVPVTWAPDAGNILVQIIFVAFLLLILPMLQKRELENWRKAGIFLLATVAPMVKETGLIILALTFVLFFLVKKDNVMRLLSILSLAVILVTRIAAIGFSFNHPGDNTAFFYQTITLYYVQGGLLTKLPYMAYTFLANFTEIFLPLFSDNGYPFLTSSLAHLSVNVFYIIAYGAITLFLIKYSRRDRWTLFLITGIILFSGLMYSEFRFRNLVIPLIMYFLLAAMAWDGAKGQLSKHRKIIVALLLAIIAFQALYGFTFVKATVDQRLATDLNTVKDDINTAYNSPFIAMSPADREGIMSLIDGYTSSRTGST